MSRIWTTRTAYKLCSPLIPQRGNDARHCTIRSTGTNTVLRPGESREGDGRKKSTSPCPEGSFSVSEISRLLRDTVETSLVAEEEGLSVPDSVVYP